MLVDLVAGLGGGKLRNARVAGSWLYQTSYGEGLESRCSKAQRHCWGVVRLTAILAIYHQTSV